MDTTAFLRSLLGAGTVAEAETALHAFELKQEVAWTPIGNRENNRGIIEVSADPGRSLVERLTNGIDAILEVEHERHNGQPTSRSPKQAATAWLNVPEGGLSELSAAERQQLARRVAVKVTAGAGKDARTVEIRDLGIGLTPAQMPNTILSLNESNKVQKHYLAGTYGQGGSSTFAVSRYTLIASRYGNNQAVGFTLVKFLDLPPEQYKTGHYVYLSMGGGVLEASLPLSDFPTGTTAKHFGYDLSSYSSAFGPTSVYGLLNRVLFDPIMPVWLENVPASNQRRVIKGARNALNGAIDEGDEERRGPHLDHRNPMFYATLADFGRIGIEYWVLEQPTKENKQPTRAFVNPSKPIVLTLNGQNHAELQLSLIKKDAELPYLAPRLICHIDCNSLTPAAKRLLFVSTREEARRGVVLDLIQQELVKALRSDDELTRLNIQAKEQSMKEQDEGAILKMRSEVARILKMQGWDVTEPVGANAGGKGGGIDRPTHPRKVKGKPEPLEIHEPPTYISIKWEESEPISFYPEQRRYVRIETDANSNYHNPNNPAQSRINIIIAHDNLVYSGSTPLQGGRMRAILEARAGAKVGLTGSLRVELTRPGLPVLSDERTVAIVEPPPTKPDARQVSLPPFDVRPVSPEDPMWATLQWPDNQSAVASAAVPENGRLVVFYSTVYPPYARQVQTFEQRDPALAASFTERYKIWVAVHSLLLQRDQQAATGASTQPGVEEDVDAVEARERQERCRVAQVSALYARNEVQQVAPTVDAEG